MSDNGQDRRGPGWGRSGEPSRPRSDDPLAELARLVEEDPFADFDRRRQQQQSEQAAAERRGEPEAQAPAAEPGPDEPDHAALYDAYARQNDGEGFHDEAQRGFDEAPRDGDRSAEERSAPAVYAGDGGDAYAAAAYERETGERTAEPPPQAEHPDTRSARDPAVHVTGFDPADALEESLRAELAQAATGETTRAAYDDSYGGYDDSHTRAYAHDYAAGSDDGGAHDFGHEGGDWTGSPGDGSPVEDAGFHAGAYRAAADDFQAEAYFAHAGAGGLNDGGAGDTDPYRGESGTSEQRSRRGIVVMASLAGLVVLGGAVALAYRGFGGGGEAGPPPVLQADTSPVKIEPETTGDEEPESQGKLVYDRVGGETSTGEARIVSREEPVFDVGGDRPVRMIETDQPGGLRGSTGTDEGAEVEPTRVRTVVVRPDGTIVSNPAPAPETSDSDEAATANEGGTDATGDATADAAAEASGEANAPSSGAEQETAFVPPSAPEPPAEPESTAAPSGGQPLQLGPGDGGEPASGQSAPDRVASAPAGDEATAADAQTANFPDGSFVVQVAASRSEEEARGTASAISQQYGSVLSGFDPAIERADLGERGIYYRVAVGPIDSQSEASSLCDRLKSAGVDCFVRRN